MWEDTPDFQLSMSEGPGGVVVIGLACGAGDPGSIPGKFT